MFFSHLIFIWICSRIFWKKKTNLLQQFFLSSYAFAGSHPIVDNRKFCSYFILEIHLIYSRSILIVMRLLCASFVFSIWFLCVCILNFRLFFCVFFYIDQYVYGLPSINAVYSKCNLRMWCIGKCAYRDTKC